MAGKEGKKKKFSIPGGNIIIPMFIGATINSFFPDLLKIGGFTTPFAQGSGALVGAFLFIIGGTISFKIAGPAVKRGGIIILTKVILSVVFGLIVGKLMNNDFLGLSALAIIGAMSGANNAMYAGIVHDFGDSVDEAAVGITILSVGPYVTMIALASSGLASFSVVTLLATILPLLVGMILANLFPAIKTILNNGMNAIIVCVGFALGCTMNFQQIFVGGASGILLGVIVTLAGGGITIVVDRLTGGSGVAGAAISSTAGAAMATPAAMAAVDESYAAVQATATAQITAAVVVTAILTPMLTAWVAKRFKGKSKNKDSKDIKAEKLDPQV
ncbi:2-keto-3-deoxygluconate permease [Companilactobacillus sp. HBUAS56257]|jgi:2-keto-3-deoxygluconate permease|uniref:2-keto-3-deoxygluconate permease n=1 Tax=Companilactobacillus sp. HBUAS56257 TaxID=3109360 RepID=UPI002FF2636C